MRFRFQALKIPGLLSRSSHWDFIPHNHLEVNHNILDFKKKVNNGSLFYMKVCTCMPINKGYCSHVLVCIHMCIYLYFF